MKLRFLLIYWSYFILDLCLYQVVDLLSIGRVSDLFEVNIYDAKLN